MFPYFIVMIGSALGGLLRFGITRLSLPMDRTFPWSTVGINILGSFVIGFVGTLTASHGRMPASTNTRLFLMVGICGGFTTFSSFSLQTFDLLRNGAPLRAGLNVLLSVLLCLGSVALGHYLAAGHPPAREVAQTAEEEFAG